jgi:two-component system nitrogen regulation sensor histidine kinase GlnL
MSEDILESLATGVVVLDRSLKVLYLNPSAEHMFRVSMQHAEHQQISSLIHVDDEWVEELEQAIRDGSTFTRRQVNVELVGKSKNVMIDYTVSPITDPGMAGGSHSAVVIECQVLDRLIRISREEAIVSSQESSRSVIRGLAHEIKNPLGGIRGAAQLLSRELDSETLRDYTKVIIDESDRLRNLVDRMLGSNRPLELEDVNVLEVLERIISLVSVEQNNAVRFRRDYDPSIPPIKADQEQLIQAVLNVVSNAVQVMKDAQTESPSITLRTRVQRFFTIGQKQHRLVCRIDVIDNGPGVAPELLQHIFHPMVSGRADGTGLGLAISQAIVIQHNGLIECHSEPGETIFSLFIPLNLPAPSNDDGASA